MRGKQSIRVALIGLDSRTHKSFEVFFATKCRKDYVIDGTTEDTPIAIMDMDMAGGEKVLKDLRSRYTQQVILAISVQRYSHKDNRIVHVSKPLDHQHLKIQLGLVKKAIEKNDFTSMQCEEKLVPGKPQLDSTVTSSSQRSESRTRAKSHSTAAASVMEQAQDLPYVGSNVDIDLSDQVALGHVRYAPANRFQGAIMKSVGHARKAGKPVEMVVLNTGVIVDPGKSIILTAVGDSLIRPLCMVAIDKISSFGEFSGNYNGKRILSLANKQKSSELISWTIDEFVWKVSLWSSRGRIPDSVDINSAVFLSSWPNLTRLQNFPYAVQIAALLSQRAVRLCDIPAYLNIPQRYVFAFISATKALGILKISQRNIDTTIAQKPTQHTSAPRSLLRKLLGRLTG